MLAFSTCRYISESHHVILKGASGGGKTYIACALGMAACRNYIKVRYIRLPDLLNELAIAHGEGTFDKVIRAYQRIDLLILDDFLLTPLETDQARELLTRYTQALEHIAELQMERCTFPEGCTALRKECSQIPEKGALVYRKTCTS